MNMSTIKDVARQAGVSITTVSHVINETRFVSEKLTQKVYDAMSDLNYRPNIIARSLRSGRTKTIGLVIPDISNPYFADFSRRIEDKGYEYGYNVILCNTDENLAKEERYVDGLISKQVDGLIFFSSGVNKSFKDNPNKGDIPIVVTDRESEGIASDVVLIDNYQGGYEATSYLISIGHRRIACISGPSMVRPSAQRVDGYLKALDEAGIPFDDALLRMGDFRYYGGEEQMKIIMKLPEPPTAVFACNDMMALGAIRTIREAGCSVPDDYSIVGFDNTPLSKYVSPQLTTISQPVKEMADLAVELLIEKIKIREDQKHKKELLPEYKRIVLDTELVIRESCAPHHS
jgi:LacI family transcriptional regulator